MTNLNDKFMVSLDLRGLMDCAKRPLHSYINHTSFMLPITEFSVHKNPVNFTEPNTTFQNEILLFLRLGSAGRSGVFRHNPANSATDQQRSSQTDGSRRS